MATRRLFSQKIVGSDAFLEMPASSRELYFQLGMYADDDGFINPKKIMRMVSASDDDLKILLLKRFLLPFENGVVVIKHWLIHNTILKDRYKETMYVEQKNMLEVKENGSYTEAKGIRLQNVNTPLTQVKLSKVKITESAFNDFWEKYPRKLAKKEAERAWNKISPSKDLFLEIITALEIHKKMELWIKDKGQFIPYAATWLNGERWKDEVKNKENKFK